MRLLQNCLCGFLIILITLPSVYAEIKGKLAGKVINQDTGQPMTEVEITLMDTPIKVLTDKTGQYFILNITPGFYDVRAFYLGFVPVVVQEVFISVDHTTRVNFQLSSTIIELGKDVTHHKGKPLIKKNETLSTYEIGSAELSRQPIENFWQLIKYLPGISFDARNRYHVRGGRSNEILFTVDDLPFNEPFQNRLAGDILTNDIHQFIFKSGAFSAEYGPAASAVLQVLNPEIPPKYSGNIAFQTGDVLTTHASIFTEEIKTFAALNNSQIEGKLSGPFPKYLSDKLSFTFSTRYWDDKGYLYGEDKFTTEGDLNNNSPAYTSLNPFRHFTLNFQLNYLIKPNLSLRYFSNYQDQKWQEYASLADHRWRFIPDARNWHYNQGNCHFLKLSHQLSLKNYYTFSLGYLWNKYATHAFAQTNAPEYRWSGWLLTDSMGEFYHAGTDNFRMSENSNTLTAKLDFTRQIGHHHLLRSGFDFKRHDITVHEYHVEVDRPDYDDNRDGVPGNIAANPDSLDDAYRHQPLEFALYLQDKLEWEPVVLNVGLRLDYFAPDAEFKTGWWHTTSDSLQTASNKFKISPRLSVAYNISDQGKLFASYGHFYQAPPYWGLYSNAYYRLYTSQYLPQFGNSDLELQKTISYEIGIEHLISPSFAASIKWFYRDFRNMMGRQLYLTPNGQLYAAVWDATDFGFTQGAIIQVTKKFSETITLDLDYTYQHTKTNNPEPYPEQKVALPTAESRSYSMLYLAEWDQPHCFQAHFNWAKPENWGITCHSRIASGYPFTSHSYDPVKDTAKYNSSRGSLQIDFDVYAFKDFRIWLGAKKTILRLELKIYNLLDRLNEKTVWPSSGKSDRPIELFQSGMSQDWMTRPFWYSKPREILVGFRYQF